MIDACVANLIRPRLAQSFWDWWLGLDAIDTGEGGLSLGWQYPLPLWAWAAIALAALVIAGWSYHRLIGARWARLSLAGVRALVLVFIAVLLAGPLLVRVTEQVEADRLLMLVDRSASMQVRDLAAGEGEPLSRDNAVRRALAAQRGVFDDPAMTEHRQVRWFGFGGEAFELGSPFAANQQTGAPPAGPDNNSSANGAEQPANGAPADASTETPGLTLPPADRQATRLRSAIDQALSRAGGHPIAGVVLLTDGRSPQTTGPAFARRLDQQRRIPVFSVPVGAKQLPLDLALTEVQAPERAFADDLVPVTVTVEQLGGQGEALPETITLDLVDAATGETADRKTISPDRLGEPIRLTGRSETPGQTQWRIELKSGEPGQPAERELNTDNNEQTVTVRVIDRPLRVLYVEGYPRWEYRFLKNLLIREKSIESSMMLLSAASDFAQEGDVPINRLPRTAEEFDRYDLIILGDVPAGTFSDKQKSLMKDHVSTTGAGILWIGGRRSTPGDYAGTALAELLPMARPGSVSRAGGPSTTVQMRPTPLARRLSVLRLKQNAADNGNGPAIAPEVGDDPGETWPADLRPLKYVQQVGPLKPATEVLARAKEATVGGRALPLVVRMRYGAGQALYLATDETWRWRYGRGEVYFQQYWIQLIRMLGRSRVQQMAGPAQLDTAHRRIDLGQTTVVELKLNDPSVAEQGLSSVDVAVTPAGESAEKPVDKLTLRPVEETNGEGGDQTGASRRTYRATWQPGRPGQLVLEVTEPALAGYDLTESIEVAAPGDELANPQTDHSRLETLANATDGAVIDLAELAKLKTAVPNRARRTANDQTEPLWHSPLALVLGLLLLTGEWVGRKVIRLV